LIDGVLRGLGRMFDNYFWSLGRYWNEIANYDWGVSVFMDLEGDKMRYNTVAGKIYRFTYQMVVILRCASWPTMAALQSLYGALRVEDQWTSLAGYSLSRS
jgi:hypothetical protein